MSGHDCQTFLIWIKYTWKEKDYELVDGVLDIGLRLPHCESKGTFSRLYKYRRMGGTHIFGQFCLNSEMLPPIVFRRWLFQTALSISYMEVPGLLLIIYIFIFFTSKKKLRLLLTTSALSNISINLFGFIWSCLLHNREGIINYELEGH